jgi:hypothetical protein
MSQRYTNVWIVMSAGKKRSALCANASALQPWETDYLYRKTFTGGEVLEGQSVSRLECLLLREADRFDFDGVAGF